MLTYADNKLLVRDYCDHKLDEALNVLVDAFLRKLNGTQFTQFTTQFTCFGEACL